MDSNANKAYWFVGAFYDGQDDQTSLFLQEGIWKNGYKDRYLDKVNLVQPGDRIAIKSTFTRKNNLPFDNHGHSVSVMTIKAVGTVIENLGNGRTLKVDWTPLNPPKEWFFYTHQKTIWRVKPGNWASDALIGFTFENKPQDIKRFCNDPYWSTRFGDDSPQKETEDMATPNTLEDSPISYSISDIINEGCFIEHPKLAQILQCWQDKKNLILQGPPGTGKTWLAKKLAYALLGQKNNDNIRAVQFHPNLSYEDFVRGWRPAGDGKLTLVDGPFLEMVKTALKDPTSKQILIIEEINRGNPAQIFGELLTLLEANKRSPDSALELSYKHSNDERIFVPENLYVIGTMNIADRSLALVDLALRRRFAFIDLEPILGAPWRTWMQDQCGVEPGILAEIERRLVALNEQIASDNSLGPQFRIGHSYVTATAGKPIKNGREWFTAVVNTEIGPLLDEYWFDSLDKSKKAKDQLLAGI